MRTHLSPAPDNTPTLRLRHSLRLAVRLVLFFVAAPAYAMDYQAVINPEKPLSSNQFQIFCPTNIPMRGNDNRSAFRAQLHYSNRDWGMLELPRNRRRLPRDPSYFDYSVLGHRTVPVVLTFSFEKVETPEDSDPVTLAKILRYSREAHAKFRILKESSRNIGGVDGSETEYAQLRRGTLSRVRHWIAHYNGIVYQLQMIVPYENPELLAIAGQSGFPLEMNFADPVRTRPLLKDADVPRTIDSPYGFQMDLREGDWIPAVHSPLFPNAEYVAYTRNQGGFAVVPVSTFGQDFDTQTLLDVMVNVAELPIHHVIKKAQPTAPGDLPGFTFESLYETEDEDMIRTHVKVVRSASHAYLAVAWINTNALVAPEILEQWLGKITFAPHPAAYPDGVPALKTFRERNRHALAFSLLGEHYLATGDFDRSATAMRTALECRFLPDFMPAYAAAENQRGHPEELLRYLKGRGPATLRQGWVAMEIAHAESRLGDPASAAAHYTQCLASGGYSVGSFSEDYFEDYIRCLLKGNRTKWAADRLRQRIACDPSPLWTNMLAKITSSSSNAIVSTRNPAAAPVPTGPPQLKSILWNPQHPSAQLDSSLLFVGDKVRGYQITRIYQDRVDIVTSDGANLTLTLPASGK